MPNLPFLLCWIVHWFCSYSHSRGKVMCPVQLRQCLYFLNPQDWGKNHLLDQERRELSRLLVEGSEFILPSSDIRKQHHRFMSVVLKPILVSNYDCYCISELSRSFLHSGYRKWSPGETLRTRFFEKFPLSSCKRCHDLCLFGWEWIGRSLWEIMKGNLKEYLLKIVGNVLFITSIFLLPFPLPFIPSLGEEQTSIIIVLIRKHLNLFCSFVVFFLIYG